MKTIHVPLPILVYIPFYDFMANRSFLSQSDWLVDWLVDGLVDVNVL